MDWHQGNPDLIIDSHLAEAAYSGHSEVHGYQKDMEFRHPDFSVYHKNGKAKIAFRGTDVKSTRDLGADALLAVGIKGNRGKRAERVAASVIKKYGKENVSATGHSLGAWQSALVSEKYGIKATGFSTPLAPSVKKRKLGNFHAISTSTDPISYVTHNLTRGVGKKTTVKTKFWNPHAVSNYI
jgi:hypothetical protein